MYNNQNGKQLRKLLNRIAIQEMKMLEEADYVRVEKTLQALSGVKKSDSQLGSMINGVLNKPFPDDLKLNCIQILGNIQYADAVENLIVILLDAAEILDLRVASADALIKINPPNLPLVFRDVLENNRMNPKVRGAVVKYAGKLKLAEFTAELLSILKTRTTDLILLQTTGQALIEMNNRTVISDLIEILNNKSLDGEGRRNAAIVLGAIQAKEAISSLRKILQTEVSPKLRICAAEALGRMSAEEATEDLSGIFSGKTVDRYETETAALALCRMKSAKVFSELLSIIQNNKADFEVRKSLINGFGTTRLRKAVGTLFEVLQDSSSDLLIRISAAKAIGKINDPAAAGKLFELLQNPAFDARLRGGIAESLAEMNVRDLIPKFTAILKNRFADFNFDNIFADDSGNLKNSDAVIKLKEIIPNDEPPGSCLRVMIEAIINKRVFNENDISYLFKIINRTDYAKTKIEYSKILLKIGEQTKLPISAPNEKINGKIKNLFGFFTSFLPKNKSFKTK
ncbi:MAG TPA: HEAT repeat domain-containing protein [Pyrinomonadaceae bacterium]|nr:HEAT repeat domain-containing protein [Pyrinomonadaceae bacterium]